MERAYRVMAVMALGVLGMAGCGEGAVEQNGTRTPPYLQGKAVPGTRPAPSPHPASPPARGSSPVNLSPTSAPASASQPSDEKAMMEKMGIEVEPGRIRIDTQKARNFFEAIERQLSSGMDRGVKKAKEHQERSGVTDLGIHVGKDRIEIDLNQTKRFMKIWGESMKILGEEVEKSLQAP